jgi:L-malate glycosyltransferase
MKILMLNYEYPPLGGGAANATAHVLREFAKEGGVSIDLVTSSTDRQRGEEFSDSIRIHFLDIGKGDNPHFQTNRELLSYSWRAYRYAKRLVARQSYDVVHAFFGIPCGYVARRLKLPYVVSLRGSDVPFYNERFKHLDRLLFKRMSIGIWKEARHVVANSKGLRDLAQQSAPSQKIEVIHNGVDTETFRPRKTVGNGLRVLCVSRLIGRKGIEYLIRAVAAIRDEEVVLTLVGKGSQEEELKELTRVLDIENRVRFTGAVEHAATVSLYQESDVFVLPSLNEGMSNTVLEAMACGLPIVMTNTGGAAELVRDGENGFLIEKRSAADIEKKLRLYAAEPGLCERHGGESRRIAEGMNWQSAAEAYQHLYGLVLEEKT